MDEPEHHHASIGLRHLPCTVADIPPELLSEFFVAARTSNVREMLPNVESVRKEMREPRAPAELLAITSTCRAWRYAALDCPALWTAIFSTYSSAIASWMLRNSKSLPLTFVEWYNDIQDATSNAVWAQHSRLRDLTLFSYHLSTATMISARVPRYFEHTTSLRTLCLAYCNYPFVNQLAKTSEFPNLRYLCLRMDVYDREYPLAPNMEAITLYGDEAFIGSVHSMFRDFSHHYLHLSFLTLQFRDVEPADIEYPPISFPHLVQLNIESEAFSVLSLAAALIRISTSCRLRLACDELRHEDDPLSEELSRLASLVSERTDGNISALPAGKELCFACVGISRYSENEGRLCIVLDSVEHSHATIRTWPWCSLDYTTTVCVEGRDRRATAVELLQAALTIEIGFVTPLSSGPVELIRRVLPLDTLHTVDLDIDGGMAALDESAKEYTLQREEAYKDAWQHLFDHLPAVTTLRASVLGPPQKHLLWSVLSNAADSVLPALKHLVFEDVEFSAYNTLSVRERRSRLHEFLHALEVWIDQRRVHREVETVQINPSGSCDRETFERVLQLCQAIQGIEVYSSERSGFNEDAMKARYIEYV